MRSALVKAVSFALAATAIAPSAVAQAKPAPWVADQRFSPVFDMYWRARLLGTNAGSRLCSFKERRNYEDPKSEYRPIDQRLKAVSSRIEVRWPGALNKVRPPYMMPPPQMLCDDEKAAGEALFGFETAVTSVERLLDELERDDQASKGR